MIKGIIYKSIGAVAMAIAFSACAPQVQLRSANKSTPNQYGLSGDSTNTADMNWRELFSDAHLVALIDTALINNQELNIALQEIYETKTEIRARKGEYLPSVNFQAGAGTEKVGRYTRNGAVEATTDIKPGEEFPEPLGDYLLAANISWEVDIWKKLRNKKKAAALRYLSSIEGRNFLVTRLVAEIANAYYEMMALDNQLRIVKQNIEIQQNALRIVRLQKQSAKVTELAVKRFEAEVLKNLSHQFYIEQQITETENEINFLVGRFPQPVARNSDVFTNLSPDTLFSGVPPQLLDNRPDLRQAALELEASKLGVMAAKAEFYPSLDISASIGYQAFNPKYLLTSPASLLYSVVGEMFVPLINRNAIKAAYFGASAKQLQAVYNYERSILNAYVEVANLQAKIANLEKSYDLKDQQVAVLRQSIDISTNLFKSAKADYMEVLLTQRDALEATMELIETKKEQLNAFVNMYQALGGGWSN